jgi:hypothetical protein
MKITHRAKVLLIAALLIIAGGGATVGVVHAVSDSSTRADAETNDDKTSPNTTGVDTQNDNGKDGENSNN